MLKNILQGGVSEAIDGVCGRRVSISDSLVVTGFWRSGTTWLQKCLSSALRAKTIFEPLYWQIDAYSKLVRSNLQPFRTDKSYVKAFMPYCTDFDECKALWDYFEQATRGYVKGKWVRRGRVVTHSFSSRVVVKFVRGQLMQAAFNRPHDPSIIHIRRDPRGVIASLLRKNWGWWMRDISVADQLLQPNDGRSEFFSPWAQYITEADKSDFLVRAATYWALTERFVEDVGLARSEGIIINYESMCQSRSDYINHQLEAVLPEGVTIKPHHMEGDSPTTQADRSRSISARIRGWEKEISNTQRQKIEEVVCRFGLEAALSDG